MLSFKLYRPGCDAQVKRLFTNAIVVGSKHPICHVRVHGGAVFEVSSFGTNADRSLIPPDRAEAASRSSAVRAQPQEALDFCCFPTQACDAIT